MHRRYIALIIWCTVIVMFFSLAWQWVAYNSSDRELTEYVEGLLRRAATDHRPAKEIRSLVLMKAEQLSIPIQEEAINITGQGQSLQTTIAYDAEIRIPLLNRALYRMAFNHNLHVRSQF